MSEYQIVLTLVISAVSVPHQVCRGASGPDLCAVALLMSRSFC